MLSLIIIQQQSQASTNKKFFMNVLGLNWNARKEVPTEKKEEKGAKEKKKENRWKKKVVSRKNNIEKNQRKTT